MSTRQPSAILVTGGCGFVGSNFINFAYSRWPNAKWINLDKLILDSNAEHVEETVRNGGRYQLVRGDIRNRALVANILAGNQVDTVIHFAADCTSANCYEDPYGAVDNNVLAFVHFLEVCRQHPALRRFVHMSTDEVYGDSPLGDGAEPMAEGRQLAPNNPYAATKAACEAFVHSYVASYQLPIAMVRVNNVYGPNQWRVKVLPKFIQLCIEGKPLTIQGSGEQLRSWLYAADAAQAVCRVAEGAQAGAVYNVGTYFELSVRELAAAVRREVDTQMGRLSSTDDAPPTEPIGDRPYNDRRYLIDIGRIEAELGWRPATDFRKGLALTVASELEKRRTGGAPKMAGHGERIMVAGAANGWLSGSFVRWLDEHCDNIEAAALSVQPGRQSDAELADFFSSPSSAPTHVLAAQGKTSGPGCGNIDYLEGGADRVMQNVRDNFYSTLLLAMMCKRYGVHLSYLGTSYIYDYDERHAVGGRKPFDGEPANFFGNSYSVAKGFADRALRHYSPVLNARAGMPLSFDKMDHRCLVAKLRRFTEALDVPTSVTVLGDAWPALAHSILSRSGGACNLVNANTISVHQLMAMYKATVDPNLSWERMAATKADDLLRRRPHCELRPCEALREADVVDSVKEGLVGYSL